MSLRGFLVAAVLTFPVAHVAAKSAAIPLAGPARPDAACRTTIDPLPIRLSNRTTLSERQLHAMTATVDAIWAPYGLRLDWQGAGPAAVDVILESRRIPPLRGSDSLPLASIEFVDNQATSTIAASHGNALTLAARARVNDRPFAAIPPPLQAALIARMLGVAIAHELGHYVLNSKQHSTSGLLRPNIPSYQLMEANVRYLRLTGDQSALLCHGDRRARAAAPAYGMDPAAGSGTRPSGGGR